jgi:hypothetical protein
MDMYQTQQDWDTFNQNMSKIFGIEYQQTEIIKPEYIISFEPIGQFNSFYGKKHTEETKQKIRQKRLLQDVTSPEYRKKMSESVMGEKNGFYGKKHNTETKQTISKHRCINEYLITDNNGKHYKTNNLKKFCKDHNLTSAGLFAVIKGTYPTHKGWKAIKINS